MSYPKIIVLDIETSPIVSYTWGTYEQNVAPEQIASEWSVLSFAVKEVGRPAVAYADTGGRGAKNVRDDRELCKMLHRILDAADIVVAQNGRAFDIKKINARFAIHGLPPYSPIRVIDTLVEAKKRFAFTSNKLAWLSKHLTDTPKSDHKKYPGFELWAAVLRDDRGAWAEMKKYNIRDVRATEKLYLRLRPWITNHPNLAAYGSKVGACPRCGSEAMTRNGWRTTQAGFYQRYQCRSCGGWHADKRQILPFAERKKMKVAV